MEERRTRQIRVLRKERLALHKRVCAVLPASPAPTNLSSRRTARSPRRTPSHPSWTASVA
eukprot:scaffold625_cov324-Pavlova_lutheri.AAC.93